MNDFSDQLLVQQILQGDLGSFEALCKRYYTSLQAVAYAVLMDTHLAEDAAQETLAFACANIAKLRKPEKAGAWLAAICRNVAKDMLGRESRQMSLGADATVKISKNDDSIDQLIQDAVSQLPASLREVVVMRYFDDKSYQQMGSLLGLSEQAINGRLRRAKKKIAMHLKQNGFRRTDP